MRFPARWLKDHPLTAADLQQEVDYLRASGFRLRVFSGGAQLSRSAGCTLQSAALTRALRRRSAVAAACWPGALQQFRLRAHRRALPRCTRS